MQSFSNTLISTIRYSIFAGAIAGLITGAVAYPILPAYYSYDLLTIGRTRITIAIACILCGLLVGGPVGLGAGLLTHIFYLRDELPRFGAGLGCLTSFALITIVGPQVVDVGLPSLFLASMIGGPLGGLAGGIRLRTHLLSRYSTFV